MRTSKWRLTIKIWLSRSHTLIKYCWLRGSLIHPIVFYRVSNRTWSNVVWNFSSLTEFRRHFLPFSCRWPDTFGAHRLQLTFLIEVLLLNVAHGFLGRNFRNHNVRNINIGQIWILTTILRRLRRKSAISNLPYPLSSIITGLVSWMWSRAWIRIEVLDLSWCLHGLIAHGTSSVLLRSSHLFSRNHWAQLICFTKALRIAIHGHLWLNFKLLLRRHIELIKSSRAQS